MKGKNDVRSKADVTGKSDVKGRTDSMNADDKGPAALAGVDLSGQPRARLRALMRAIDEPAFRGDQLFSWLHRHLRRDLAAMSNLPKPLREQLRAARPPTTLSTVRTATSALDASRKLVLATAAGHLIETVIMPMAGGSTTQCLSSQVGCRMGCDFCATAEMPGPADLGAAEIVEQVAVVCRLLYAEGGARGGVAGNVRGPLSARPHNLVFMGMGEPLDNFNALIDALAILVDDKGYGFSPRRITVSTSGIAKRLPALVQAYPRLNLAWSLTATTDELRQRLMPIGRGVPIDAMMATLEGLPGRGSRKLTLEYALLAGVNDSPEDAQHLVKMARTLGAHVNAIPFNVYPGARYDRPSPEVVQRFEREVARAGGSISVRESKGRDIGAACGQLAGAGPDRRETSDC